MKFKKKIKKIKNQDIIIFTRHLSTLINAGFSIKDALITIAQGHDNDAMKNLANQLNQTILIGKTFSQALQQYPNYFSNLYCNMIQIGEKTGGLEKMLEHVANYQEKILEIKAKLRKTLLYPSAVIVIGIFVAIVLSIFVIPHFETMFQSFGSNLPAFTKFIINISRFLKNIGWLIILLLILGILLINHIKRHSTSLSLWLANLQLNLSIIGPIIKKIIIARFARTLATTLKAGIPILESLNITADII